MGIEARGYTMHVRCDFCDAKALRKLGILPSIGQFSGENFADCRRQAKAAGWTFKRDGRAKCKREHK